MIDIQNYENNKIYVPEKLNNGNYKYILDNQNIIIITNENCTQNYNSTYCDTYKYYQKENVLSEVYQTNINNNNNVIKYEYITSDISNNVYIKEQYIEYIGVSLMMLLIGITFATFLTKERSSY